MSGLVFCKVKRFFLVNAAWLSGSLLVACSGTRDEGILDVKLYQMPRVDVPNIQSPMARSNALRTLYGAVTVEEMEQRLGHQYLVTWRVKDHLQPVEILFEYQQAATASTVHRQVVRVTKPAKRKNRTKIKVVGDDYAERGPVLAWKMTLRQGGQVLDTESSFLWRD